VVSKKRKSLSISEPQFGLDSWAAMSDDESALPVEKKSRQNPEFPDLKGQDAFDFVVGRFSSTIFFKAFDALVDVASSARFYESASAGSVLHIYFKLLRARIDGDFQNYIESGSNKLYRKQISIHKRSLFSSVDHLVIPPEISCS